MDKRVQLIMIPVEIALQSVLFFVGMTVLGYEPLQYTMGDFPRCFAVLLPVAAAYWLRHCKTSGRKFFAAHAGMVCMGLLFGRNDVEKFFLCCLILVLAAFSYQIQYANKRADKERPSYFFVAVMLYAAISGRSYGSSVVVNTAFAGALVYILLSVLHSNLFRLGLVCQENRETMDFPERQLSRVNTSVIAGALFFMAVAGLALAGIGTGHFGWLTTLFQWFGKWIAMFLIWLIELLGKGQTRIEGMPQVEETQGEDILEYFTDQSDGNVERLMNAVIIVAGIIIVAAFLYGVLRVFRAFLARIVVRQPMFLGGKAVVEGSDTIEFIQAQERKRLRVQRGAKERGGTNSEKYRREYRKKVLRGAGLAGRGKNAQKTFVDAGMTPAELTRSHITHDEVQADMITRSYEKARYSNELISKEEINFLKRL